MMVTRAELYEAERLLFEADAICLGYELTRASSSVVSEPWSEYSDSATGHRWAGWLAASGRSL